MSKNPFDSIPNEAFEAQVSEITGQEKKPPHETISQQKKAVEEMGGDPAYNKPPNSKTGARSAFQPAESSDLGADIGEAMSFNEEDIFDFVADSLTKKIDENPQSNQGGGANSQGQPRPTYNTTKRATAPAEVFDPEQLEVAAIMYVEVLEMVTVIVCEWIAGVPGAYSFKKTLKEKYAVISAKVMQHEKVMVSPMHLFILATIVILGGSVWAAFKEKKKIARQIEYKERAKSAVRSTGQGKLFELDTVDIPRKNFAVRTVDGVHYYNWNTTTDARAKKDELEEVPAELAEFLLRYYRENSKWPDKRTVQHYLRTTGAAA